MEFNEVIKGRYSCRGYAPTPIADEVMDRILEGARVAFTAKNLQGQRIYLLKSEESHKIFDGNSPCRYGAPVVAVLAYDKNEIFTLPGGKHTSGEVDATIVGTHMALAAANEGVNSCWLASFSPEKLASELGLPENIVIVGALDLGYAADGIGPNPPHAVRKPVSETVTVM